MSPEKIIEALDVNTNDLRDYADRVSNPCAQLILDAAHQLDVARTDRNILDGLVRELCERFKAMPREWQPIETAPTHKEVLVYRDDAGVMLGILTCLADWLIHEDDLDHGLTEDELWENRWFALGKSGALPLRDDGGDPTHWMPLPKPPPPEAEA